MSLTKVNQEEMDSLSSKLKNIKCVLLDVDGILTDGGLFSWEKKLDGIGSLTSTMGMALKCLSKKISHRYHFRWRLSRPL